MRLIANVMRRRFAPGISLLLLSAAILLAADFWEKKAPEDWTNEEVEHILTDSPWAHELSLKFIGDTSQPIGGGSRGGGIGFPGQSRRPGAGGGSSLPDGGWGGKFAAVGTRADAFEEADLVVRWSSAAPIRQALLRAGAQHIEERPHLLEDYYVISLSRIPAPLARLADEPEKLRALARLIPKDRPAIGAARIELRPQPGTPGIELYFPRSTGLSLDDRQITFELNGDDYEATAKFKPRDMIYHGRLEL